MIAYDLVDHSPYAVCIAGLWVLPCSLYTMREHKSSDRMTRRPQLPIPIRWYAGFLPIFFFAKACKEASLRIWDTGSCV